MHAYATEFLYSMLFFCLPTRPLKRCKTYPGHKDRVLYSLSPLRAFFTGHKEEGLVRVEGKKATVQAFLGRYKTP